MTEMRIYVGQNGKIHVPPEYRSDVVYGANVKVLAKMLCSEGIMLNDRSAVFLNADRSDAPGLSEKSIHSFCGKLAEAFGESIRNLETFLN